MQSSYVNVFLSEEDVLEVLSLLVFLYTFPKSQTFL